MGTQQKGQIREGLEIWQGGRQEVSHSSLEKNLTHFYSNIKMKFGELGATQAISDFYGKSGCENVGKTVQDELT